MTCQPCGAVNNGIGAGRELSEFIVDIIEPDAVGIAHLFDAASGIVLDRGDIPGGIGRGKDQTGSGLAGYGQIAIGIDGQRLDHIPKATFVDLSVIASAASPADQPIRVGTFERLDRGGHHRCAGGIGDRDRKILGGADCHDRGTGRDRIEELDICPAAGERFFQFIQAVFDTDIERTATKFVDGDSGSESSPAPSATIVLDQLPKKGEQSAPLKCFDLAMIRCWLRRWLLLLLGWIRRSHAHGGDRIILSIVSQCVSGQRSRVVRRHG